MANRIEEYNPQVQAPGPQGGTSPVLEAVGELGRGVEELGNQVTTTADRIESRTDAMESAYAQSTAAQMYSSYFDRIKDETNKGTLNQQKIEADWSDEVSEASQQFDSARGRAEFERATGRSYGALMRKSAAGAIQIAGNNAKIDFLNTANNITSVTRKSPDLYQTNQDQLEETINAVRESGPLDPRAIEELRSEKSTENAQAMIRGRMDQDYANISKDVVALGMKHGTVNLDDPKYNTAKLVLDASDSAGKDHWGKWLNESQRNALSEEINNNKNKARQDGQMQLNAIDTNRQKAVGQFLGDNFGRMSAADPAMYKEIENNPDMSFEQKKNASNYMYSQMMHLNSGNPAKTQQYLNMINTDEGTQGHIYSLGQLDLNGMNASEANGVKQALANRPYNQQSAKARSGLLDEAKQTFQANSDSLGQMASLFGGGHKTAKSVQQQNDFELALGEEEKKWAAEGKDPRPLYDRKSPHWFGNMIHTFMEDPSKQMEAHANSITGAPSSQTATAAIQQAPKPAPEGKIRVRAKTGGPSYLIDKGAAYDSKTYEKVE